MALPGEVQKSEKLNAISQNYFELKNNKDPFLIWREVPKNIDKSGSYDKLTL